MTHPALEYDWDDALNDLLTLQRFDLTEQEQSAFGRLEQWLMEWKGSGRLPPTRDPITRDLFPVPGDWVDESGVVCNDCILLCGRDGTCSHPDMADDFPEQNPRACEFRVRFGAVGVHHG